MMTTSLSRPREHSIRNVVFAFIAFAMVIALGCIFHADGAFFAKETHADAIWQLSGYGVLACGMTVVIITGGIDLSVGSVVALVSVVFASLIIKAGMNPWFAMTLSVLSGVVAGVLSGFLVGYFRVQAFIATLAMMAFARGLAKYICELISGGAKITQYPTPPGIEMVNTRIDILGTKIAVGVFVLAICAIGTWLLLRRTALGVRVYAVGDNEEAARYAGLSVRWTKLFAYAYCGAMAGIAGVLFGATERQGNPDTGVGYELTAIAMVVIGGTSLAGGRGGAMLTMLGALTIGYLKKVLDLNAIETYMQLMITGVIIVLAVLVRGFPGRHRQG